MFTVEDKAHAELGPSGWDRWGNCAASVPLSRGIERSSSSYARLGTAAHQLLEDCLLGDFDAEDLIGREYIVEGEVFTVDTDMADAIDAAINVIKEELDPEKGDILMAEQSVPLQQLTGEEGAEGTSDIIGLTDGGKTLVVMDYKHGQGVKVYASEYQSPEEREAGEKPTPNGQMGMYALGALEKYGLIYDDVEQVKMVVLQPRQEHVDELTISVEDLREFGRKVTEAAGRVELNIATFEEHGDLTLLDFMPTEKGCKFCDVKSRPCPALEGMMTNAMSTVSAAEDFENLTLPKKAASLSIGDSTDGEKLAEIMRATPMIETFLKEVRAEVERRLLAGKKVPGYKLVAGRAPNRSWLDADEALTELTKNASRLKVAEATTSKVISPTQAEKLLKDKPRIWSQIAPLIAPQGEGSPTVAKADDPRPELQLVSDASEFEDLSEPASLEAAPSADLMAD